MVEFINKVTGSKMYVHESRVAEYIAEGHAPSADAKKPTATKRKRKTAK